MDEKDRVVEEQAKLIEQMCKEIVPMYDQLQEALAKITKVNDILGYAERSNSIRKLIKEHGWDVICKTFHPDNNINDPAAYEMFELCKYLHEDMKRKGEV